MRVRNAVEKDVPTDLADDLSEAESVGSFLDDPQKVQEISQSDTRKDPVKKFPTWARLAMFLYEVYGWNKTQISKKFGKTLTTIKRYINSAVGDAYRAEIKEYMNNELRRRLTRLDDLAVNAIKEGLESDDVSTKAKAEIGLRYLQRREVYAEANEDGSQGNQIVINVPPEMQINTSNQQQQQSQSRIRDVTESDTNESNNE